MQCCVRTESHVLWPQNCWQGSTGQPSSHGLPATNSASCCSLWKEEGHWRLDRVTAESLTRHSGSFSELGSSRDQKRILIFYSMILLISSRVFNLPVTPHALRPLSHIGHQCGLSIHWYYECGLSTFTPSGLSVWKRWALELLRSLVSWQRKSFLFCKPQITPN